MIRYFIFLLALAGMYSCETVKPYQRVYLNDADMALKPGIETLYEMSFEAYREGSVGATGGKGGGGCGCN
ncbi:MAG TPA: DUF4266 domain-containing protein [Saprospiraceae bacterium]|nr:DUF4266 domain-containing protein [Saprospiraceae bacterium]HMQ83615.1 DUF4266 domain-containing protein [Saprospiraceae bacterium]